MMRNFKYLTKLLLRCGLAVFLILLLSNPTDINCFNQSSTQYMKWIKNLCSFYTRYSDQKKYYLSLEKNTSFYKLVLNQLNGKEKAYFLQMRPFISEIAKASQKTGIPMSSLASHIKRESQFNPWAISSRGAYGLMGVTIWAYRDVIRLRSRKKWIAAALSEYGDLRWRRVKDNPELNIIVGAIYYKFLLNEFKDTTLASLAYNWGMGNVYLMQEKYGDKESIIARLEELAANFPAWVEPAKYPEHISSLQAVFRKVEKRIKLAYAAYHELNGENLTFLRPPRRSSSL